MTGCAETKARSTGAVFVQKKVKKKYPDRFFFNAFTLRRFSIRQTDGNTSILAKQLIDREFIQRLIYELLRERCIGRVAETQRDLTSDMLYRLLSASLSADTLLLGVKEREEQDVLVRKCIREKLGTFFSQFDLEENGSILAELQRDPQRAINDQQSSTERLKREMRTVEEMSIFMVTGKKERESVCVCVCMCVCMCVCVYVCIPVSFNFVPFVAPWFSMPLQFHVRTITLSLAPSVILIISSLFSPFLIGLRFFKKFQTMID
jgi:hypothetical protein